MNENGVRTSQVGVLYIIGASSSTTVQLGDRGETDAMARALAVQRQEEHLTSGEVFFESYDVFSRPLPVLVDPAYDAGQVIKVRRSNAQPCIRVGCIRVTAAAVASTIQIGNGRSVRCEARIKHIRQYPIDRNSLHYPGNGETNQDE